MNEVNKIPRAVVYPICNGNYTDSNVPLMLSLRSIDENLLDDVPVVVISERMPSYLSDEVLFIECDGYMDALRKATSLAEEILWMNDDIHLLHPITWESAKSWYVEDVQQDDADILRLVSSDNKWRNRRGQVLDKLRDRGDTLYNFSTHTPYLYESSKLIDILEDFDFGYKTAVETAYGNAYSVPTRPISTKLSRHHPSALPIDMSKYSVLNHNDKGFTPHTRGFLLGKFPSVSRYEDYGTCDVNTTLITDIK
tara:strand:- start:1533 stop:2291 length:759 start_codon:yes stop_codon:yes gene_type:complete